jgi:hypothetical protein
LSLPLLPLRLCGELPARIFSSSRTRKNVDVNFCSLYSAPSKGGDIAMAKKKSAKKTTKKTTKKGMKK